jgi:ComEC/Rec2-related protein
MKFLEQPRQPLTGLFLAAAPGIAAAEFWPANPLPVLGATLVFAAALIRWRSTAAVLLFTALAFFLLHDFRIHNNPGKTLAHEFSAQPLPVRASGVVVTEPEEKADVKNIPACQFQLRLESIEANGKNLAATGTVVLVRWLGEAPAYGDRVSLAGDARNLAPPRNPGQFDYAGWLNRAGIFSEIRMTYPSDGLILSHGAGSRLVALSIVTRRWLQEKLTLDLGDSPEIAGLIEGMTLGLKSETPGDIRELFQRTGTLHLFVVNGLHIGMFAYIAFLFIKLLGLGRRRGALIVIPLIFFYALLTGLSPGSIRASVMAAIVLAGQFADRKPITLNNLAAAGLALLVWDTNELFMPGFQFSFGVVASIILFAGKFQRFFIKFGTPDSFLPRSLWSPFQNGAYFCWKYFSQILGVSTAAWIGSLPFTTTYFHLMSPTAVIANLVAVPLAFVILAQGVLAVLSAIFSGTLATVFNNSNWLCARAILWAMQHFAQIPGGYVYVELPHFKKQPLCEITVFDLGVGGAIHLRADARDWLLDCGSQFSYENTVRPYLRSRGVNRLDGFGLSHGSAQFIGAASLVTQDFRPEKIVDSTLADRSPARRDFQRWLAAQHVAKAASKRGDALEISASATICVLYPPPGINARLADDKALVLRLECDGASVLFMSSSGFLTERWLLENEPNLRADILVKNQHVSDISGTPDFIEAVKPQAIICSAADFPPRARIDETWAQDVAALGIRLFRQDETGAVRVELNRDGFVVRPFLGGQIFRSSRR